MKIWTLSKTNTEVRDQAERLVLTRESSVCNKSLILGLEGLVSKLKVDLDKGLTGVDF